MSVNDNINIEYEARVMVTYKEYKKVLDSFSIRQENKKEIENVNHYFDTPDRYLSEHHMVLRIREIDNKDYELTLKIQQEKGCMELNHTITKEEVKEYINGNIKLPGLMIEELSSRRVNVSWLAYVTTLKTNRTEFYYPKYILVIDKNEYNNKVDYNIEVESNSDFVAESLLKEIIAPFGIKYKKDYISKSRRAIYNL